MKIKIFNDGEIVALDHRIKKGMTTSGSNPDFNYCNTCSCSCPVEKGGTFTGWEGASASDVLVIRVNM